MVNGYNFRKLECELTCWLYNQQLWLNYWSIDWLNNNNKLLEKVSEIIIISNCNQNNTV